ncbi:DUF748 domain-containing protein [Geobacter sp. DSM 9736]|uniref:DUF748 domain-containing protein n=1 Tax=Geobacter sp. DSM 9736 TaxID=1277350 RepID=UPI000B5E486F|nr:DUF748 domain-containing protein [Geobacter sp. DSM 9736]SNB46528.1 protein of unknown function [Geobacter sp. DSM 9736]
MKRWQRVSCALLVLLGIVVLLAALAGPMLIRNGTIRRVEEATGRKLTIGSVAVNPFTLSARYQDVRLAEKEGPGTFLSFSSARISLSPRSLIKGAPIVSSLAVDSPRLSIERTAANRYSFSDILERREDGEPGAKTPRSAGESARFSINNITVRRGIVSFTDRGLPAPKRHTLSSLSIDIPFISTMPYMADRYVTPRFAGLLNGAPVGLAGRLKIFPSLAEASVAVNLRDMSLPHYAAYLPAKLPFTLDGGALSTAAEIRYRVGARSRPELSLSGTATLAGARIREAGGAPLAALGKGTIAVKEANLFGKSYDLSSLDLQGLELHLKRSREGRWNVVRLKKEADRIGEEEKGAKREARLRVLSARLRDGRLFFDDRKPSRPFETRLDGISVDLTGYSSDGSSPARFALSCTSKLKETLAAEGTITSAPVTAALSVTLNDLPLARYYPYMAEYLTAPVKGTVSMRGEVSYDIREGLRIGKGELDASSLSAVFGPGEGLKLQSAVARGARFDLSRRKLDIERIGVRGSDLSFSRDESGNLSPLRLLRKEPQTSGDARTQAAQKGKKPFSASIGTINGEKIGVRFRDSTGEGRRDFALRQGRFMLKNVSIPSRTKVAFSFSSSYGKGGRLKASGEYLPEPAGISGTFEAKGLPLVEAASYLPENIEVEVADGSLDATGRVNLARREGSWGGSFGGAAVIRSFHCLDASGEDLLTWENLQLDGISGTLSPFTLLIDDVVLNHYFSKIVVRKDGSLNVQNLRSAPVGEAAGTATSGAGGGGRRGEPAPSMAVGRMVMQDGVLDFSDLHLRRPYSATLFNLGGRVSGLNSDPASRAEVDLRGNLENQSPLRITGQINPLRGDLFADLKVEFSDIELPPLTPYSATYLGYNLDRGRLFLNLQYRIDNKRLESSNNVLLDELVLGKEVPSERATSLPVKLAIALLKDRKGEIHLNLPVSGRTDDPQFSFWNVVVGMVKNLALKAARSPFTLLQSMFGGKGDFSNVSFGYGTSFIGKEEREKLERLATALRERPALNVEVTGYVDREHDAEGIRREHLDRKMRSEKLRQLVEAGKAGSGDSPDSVRIPEEEYGKYLERVYRAEEFPKPRTIIGTIKDLPEAEMTKLILANTVVGTKDLQALAAARAETVRDYLVGRGKVDPARVQVRKGDIFKEPAGEKEMPSRVELTPVAD